jgi:hypothetical protein
MGKRALPAIGILAGGLVHSLLPLGAFGRHDRLLRAALVGMVAAATAAIIFILTE